MMHGDDLFKLVEDVKLRGVRVPIGLYDELDADGNLIKTWLIDGRNRLEAAQRAGLDIADIPTARVHCSDPVSWIISLNIRRRHLSKQQAADLTCAVIQQAREADSNSHQNDEKLGRGRKPGLRAAVVAVGKEVGFSPTVADRTIAKAKGKVPKRRTAVEIRRDTFVERSMPFLSGIAEAVEKMRDVPMDRLREEERIEAVKIMETVRAGLKLLIDRCRLASEEAA